MIVLGGIPPSTFLIDGKLLYKNIYLPEVCKIMKFSAILVNIEGLDDKSAEIINNTFIGALGKVRHSDGMAFFRDLQPVCREQENRAKLVDGVKIEILQDEDDDAKCEFNIVCMGKEAREFNAILVLEFDGNVYSINRLYLFVPNEKVSPLSNFHISVESIYGDEIKEEDEDDKSADGAKSDD